MYIGVYAAEWEIPAVKASETSSYPTLTFRLGCILLIPMYIKFGRRPTMLFSQLLYVFGTLGCAVSTSYNGFLACRIIHSLGSGVCEALPVQCVNDIYFLHERGKRLSYYTVALCLGAIGPLPAGYMLAAGYSFRLFFYVEFAFAVALFIATFFLVPETAYKRKTHTPSTSSSSSADIVSEKDASVSTHHAGHATSSTVEVGGPAVAISRKSYLASLKPWSGIDHEADFWMMIVRSFSYFLVPQVLWVITSFGES